MVRLLDVLASAVCLAWVAPLFAAIALIVALDGSGPVFERTPRTGRDGRLVTLLTFRVPDGSGALGALIRDTRLNELPLLLNLLQGDLTLFGAEAPNFGVIDFD